MTLKERPGTNIKKVIDISMNLNNGLLPYPGDTKFNHNWVLNYDKENNYSVSSISMSCHSGTHVDAPYHFNPNGLRISEIPEDLLIGTVFIKDTKDREVIEAADIPSDITIDRIIFKTSKRHPENDPKNPHLSLQATLALVDKGIRLVGINQMSIEKPDSTSYPVHKLLTKNNIFIIENLVLDNVDPGYYRLICAPLKISEAEAAPCRVLLEEL